jgi:hypothetical protein
MGSSPLLAHLNLGERREASGKREREEGGGISRPFSRPGGTHSRRRGAEKRERRRGKRISHPSRQGGTRAHRGHREGEGEENSHFSFALRRAQKKKVLHREARMKSSVVFPNND